MAKFFKVHVLVLTAIVLGWANVAAAGSVTLAWDAVNDGTVAGYNVYWGTQSGVYTSGVSVGNTNSYTVSGLTDGTAYYFVVRSYNSAGISGASIEVSRRVGVSR